MADEEKKDDKKGNGSGAMNDLFFVVGVLAILIVLWIVRGGLQKGGVGGLFLSSPIQTASSTQNTSGTNTSIYNSP